MPEPEFWPLAIYGSAAVLCVVYRDAILRFVCHRVGYCRCSGGWRLCDREWKR